MTQAEQQKAAKTFAENWSGKGDEKQETQRYWMQLLGEVLGVRSPASYIEFEKRVKLSHTSFIDAYIPETKVLIEQKGLKIDLNKAYEQSDGTVLTPYEQAKRYADEMPYDLRPRWIVVSNFAEIHVHDMNRPEEKPEVIFLKDLEKDFYRLEFLVDRKNENIRREEEISIAAGHLVGKMRSAFAKEYLDAESAESSRSLNILCVRIVFCFYAEDAGLFETRTSFEDYIKSFNIENLRDGIIKLFKALDTKKEKRDKYDTKLNPFPYVNGGLFHDENIEIPNFTQEIVDVLVNDCAVFNWSEISPTIFGAAFESTLNPETRRKGGMHYTSVQNIHKVIDPLFLDGLNAEFEKIKKISAKKERTASLASFQKKLGSLAFLDPACGSGNFLTESYLSLRRLENKVISLLNEGEKALGFDEFICVKISSFYGIEINDFAVAVAKSALWIAENQMIEETEKILGQQISGFLPLKTSAVIVEGNALRMDWATLEPEDTSAPKEDGLFAGITTHVDGSEHHYDYIMGNPPFIGAMWMKGEKREDMEIAFPECKKGGEIDYVAAWYAKATKLIQNSNIKCAFVSTNSITQGQQVDLIWKPLFKNYHIKFDFAYRTFRWDSESTEKAHVHCVIVGFSGQGLGDSGQDADESSLRAGDEAISSADKKDCFVAAFGTPRNDRLPQKFIVSENGEKHAAHNINGYLLDAPDIFIESRNEPLCDVPEILMGSMPRDGGGFVLSEDEKNALIKKESLAEKWIHLYLGADEFINGKKRYCLWLKGASPAEIKKCPTVYKRVESVKNFRLASKAEATRKFAAIPTLFCQIAQPESGHYIIVPKVSSEKRSYIPLGFMDSTVIASDLVFIIPNATLFHFGVLTSSVHMAWMRAVCGRLKSDYRYSKDIVYNNFVWPGAAGEFIETTSNGKGHLYRLNDYKAKIEQTAQAILDTRAKYPDSSLAELYDETLMPPDLRKAHEANDRAVMQAYGFDAKMTETEIVARLFKMYEKLAASFTK